MILVTGATGLNGSAVIAAWFRSTGAACAGARLVPLAVNGGAGFAQYRRDSDGTAHQAFAIHVIQSSGDRITALHTFLDPTLFALFGLRPTSS
jgi:RNA polymerase sigma-70 factor (ECF subfamily)